MKVLHTAPAPQNLIEMLDLSESLQKEVNDIVTRLGYSPTITLRATKKRVAVTRPLVPVVWEGNFWSIKVNENHKMAPERVLGLERTIAVHFRRTLRINLNEDGTATYFLWKDGDLNIKNIVAPKDAMKMIAEGAQIDLTALDPDNHDRVFSNMGAGVLVLEEN